MKKLFLILLFGGLTIFFQIHIPSIYHHKQPVAYLPSGNQVFVTTSLLGPIAPDIIWFTAIQYFGEEKLTGGTFEFLYDIFNTLITIDPEFEHGYKFGSVIISEEGGEPEKAIELMKKGCVKNPESWVPPFYIGFINYAYIGNYMAAGRYFELASRKYNAPEITYKLSALAYRKTENREGQILAWSRIYKTTENRTLKEAALRNIKYIIIDKHLDFLEEELQRFKEENGHNPSSIFDFVKPGSIPEEPFGGTYRYSISGDSCFSTTYTELDSTISFLNNKLKEFKERFGVYPHRLDELVARDIMIKIPEHPLGAFYQYRKGKVIKVSR